MQFLMLSCFFRLHGKFKRWILCVFCWHWAQMRLTWITLTAIRRFTGRFYHEIQLWSAHWFQRERLVLTFQTCEVIHLWRCWWVNETQFIDFIANRTLSQNCSNSISVPDGSAISSTRRSKSWRGAAARRRQRRCAVEDSWRSSPATNDWDSGQWCRCLSSSST